MERGLVHIHPTPHPHYEVRDSPELVPLPLSALARSIYKSHLDGYGMFMVQQLGRTAK